MFSFLEYLVFFAAVFCSMDFDIFFAILIFDLNSGFFRGYSVCMIADFQNGLISRIFSVFWSGFFHGTTSNNL